MAGSVSQPTLSFGQALGDFVNEITSKVTVKTDDRIGVDPQSLVGIGILVFIVFILIKVIKPFKF